MSNRLIFSGRVSARLGAALSLVCELTRSQAQFTGAGFNPHSGFIPVPRTLSSAEAALLNTTLEFLKAGYNYEFQRIDNRSDAVEFGMWTYAAQTYIEFVLSCTTEFSVAEGAEQFDMPPHPEPRKLTKLEQDTYEAALAFITRGYTVTIDEELNALLLAESVKSAE